MLPRSVIGLILFLLSTASTSVDALSYLPFLNFGSSDSVCWEVLDGTRSVSLPSSLQFGDSTYTTEYVSTCNVHNILYLVWYTDQ